LKRNAETRRKVGRVSAFLPPSKQLAMYFIGKNVHLVGNAKKNIEKNLEGIHKITIFATNNL